MPKRIGLFPGTFDPITKGHLDIIQRATKFIDYLIVAIAEDSSKSPLFSLEHRLAMTTQAIEEIKPSCEASCVLEVCSFKGLLVHFAEARKATLIIRGLRAVSDFEYEFKMVGMNSYLSRDVETIFLMSSERYHFIASNFVKQVALLGGDVSEFVLPFVDNALKEKAIHYKKENKDSGE